ncbi:MAG TPA: F0F1 ATP synthase subunit delta [Casimicrobiaceae bacterium]|jgi:F-type H+-transporting ATPase subunit delta|nr:F0F1 ATP synthase subunit delta [Casimicrobiaceae bacterium]
MAELETVARPYAEAAFETARDAKALPQWSSALKVAAAVVADPRMQGALDNPRLTAAEKETLFLSVAADGFPAGVRNFARVLIESDRIGLLPQIRELFEARKDAAEGVARASIETALPLSDEQLGQLKSSLAKHFGKAIEATVHVDPSLIGGARITVGDRVIDGTVQGKLTAMANELIA